MKRGTVETPRFVRYYRAKNIKMALYESKMMRVGEYGVRKKVPKKMRVGGNM
jgi:hypothetical protein